MKVEIIKQNLGDECSYKYKPMSFCCEKLARNPVIELVADRYDVTKNYISEPQFCIANYEEWTEWEEEFHRDDYYPIKFCPFCGEKIETEIIREVIRLKLSNQMIGNSLNTKDIKLMCIACM